MLKTDKNNATATHADCEVEGRSLEAPRGELPGDQLGAELEIESMRREMEEFRTKLAADTAALAEERRCWEEQRKTAEAGATHESFPGAADVERAGGPTASEEKPSSQAPACSADESASTAPSDAPADPSRKESDDDIFARLRQFSVLRESGSEQTSRPADAVAADDQGELEPASALAHPAEDSPDATPRDRSTPADGHENSGVVDDSIDDYMSRLLARLNGNRQHEASKPGVAVEARPLPETVPTKQAPQPKPEPVEPPQVELTSLTPRRPAPEGRADMLAMREVARMSAQSAISASLRKRWIHAAASKAAVAGVALVVAVAMIGLAEEIAHLTFVSGLVALIIAGLFGWQTMWLIKRLQKSGGPGQKPHANPTSTAAQRPADADNAGRAS